MIGAGVFTSTGFQVAEVGHPMAVLVLWAVGGGLAFCGALCYAELGAAMPQAGGEYVYLRETYGEGFAFTSAFVSLTAGFSAPIAAALKGAVIYLGSLIPFAQGEASGLDNAEADLLALGLLWSLVAIQYFGPRRGIGFNDWLTLAKVIGIGSFILAAFVFGAGEWRHFTMPVIDPSATQPVGGWSAYGTSLIFVMFCYTGWNASAYVAGEIREPQRNVPRSLLLGTALVTCLYLGLNGVYFYGASSSQLAGQADVGVIAARELFGQAGQVTITVVLAVSILASASAMLIAAPRVYVAFGRDMADLNWLTHVNNQGAPGRAILLQGGLVTVAILSGRIDQIMQYAGFTLALFSCLAVSCVLVLRMKRPNMQRPFRTWGYPWTPLLFIGVSLWTMVWAMRGRPLESTSALATVLVGGMLFVALRKRRKPV